MKKKSVPFFRKKSTMIYLYIICGIIAILLGVLLYRILMNVKLRPVTENPKTEMKQLPPSIKRKLSRVSPEETFRVPVLMYHYVEYVQDKKDTIRQALDIVPYIFDAQIKTLSDAGYTFMTAKDMGDVLDGRRLLPKKPIIITIDDGHWDLDTDILPILKKYHAKATAYIISGFIGGSDFLSKEQLQDVIASGLVEIGAHTIHHVALKSLPLTLVQNEVAGSKKVLEDEYHIHVVSFAYPDGSFDEQAAHVVKGAGFETAVSTVPGIAQSQQNRYFLYRIRPGGRTGAQLINYLQQNNFQAY